MSIFTYEEKMYTFSVHIRDRAVAYIVKNKKDGSSCVTKQISNSSQLDSSN